MRDRDLAPVALAGAIVSCGAFALVAGLSGSVVLATIGRFTAGSVAALGVVVAIAWRLSRRRDRRLGTGDLNNRPGHVEETSR